MADVTMPQLGETVTEGTITRWMKAVGDTVARDEPLFEVSTDKVDSEVPSPADGVLREILVPEGETVEVGARLAVIGEAGAGVPAGAAPAAPSPAAAAPPPPPPAAAPPPPTSPPTAAAPPPQMQPPAPAPPAPPPATAAPPPPPAAPAPPPTWQPSEPAIVWAPPPASPPPAAPPPPAPGASAPGGSRPEDARILSPVVRRLLAENGIDPSQVTGTGLGGRITREDVLAYLDARRGAPATAPAPTTSPAPATPPPVAPAAPPAAAPRSQPEAATVQAPPPPPQMQPPAAATPPAAVAVPPPAVAPTPAASPAPSVPRAAPGPSLPTFRQAGERVVPFSNMRRRTAEHMVRSKATSPHAFIAYETDFENVERVRKEWGSRFRAEEGFSLTYLPFVARATVEALRDFPNLNASVVEDALVVHQQINLGIAVDLDHEGLIVPVIHRAEEVTLRGIARRIRDVADRARSRQLTADDISSGTFSITNDGPFGSYFTVPIINQPQVAILATDGVKRRPVVVTLPDGTESIAIHSMGLLGMSWDHRAVDGAYVATFLARVAGLLATRDWAAEL
ncbi:MAG TPA: dihydrolipoamide acetyltransferase family protein [Acidimicrobiales bacterium]|nr:dihydrolipoamide acetyltransferase family protein [Acidimicrobiales bacterium]